MGFRTKTDFGATIAMVVAALVLAVTLGFTVAAKQPKVAHSRAQMSDELTKIQIDIKRTMATMKTETDAAGAFLWTGNMVDVVHAVLDRATTLSQQHKLKIVAFRPPQKSVDAPNLSQLPFQMTIQGSFPQVAALVRDLETPSERLCVNLVQIAAAEGSTDSVTATVGMVAFTPPVRAAAKTAPAKPGTSTTTTTTTTVIPGAKP